LLQSDHRKGMGSSVKTPPQSPPPPPLSTSSLSTSKGPPLEERKGTAVKPSSVHSSRYRWVNNNNMRVSVKSNTEVRFKVWAPLMLLPLFFEYTTFAPFITV
jgi:hypothetical protein